MSGKNILFSQKKERKTFHEEVQKERRENRQTDNDLLNIKKYITPMFAKEPIHTTFIEENNG